MLMATGSIDARKMLWTLILLGLLGAIAGVFFLFFSVAPSNEQTSSSVTSYTECVEAGNAVQMSYPEVCTTKDGQRFVNE